MIQSRMGVSILAVGDHSGYKCNPEGLNAHKLYDYVRAHGSIESYPHGRDITRDQFFAMEADICVPAALQDQIGGIQALVKRSVDAIGHIGKTIGQVDGIAASIAAAVEEQGGATQEIARNVQEASVGSREVTENVQRVAEVNSETGTAADQVLTAAGGLAQQAETLKAEVDRFLARVRAA